MITMILIVVPVFRRFYEFHTNALRVLLECVNAPHGVALPCGGRCLLRGADSIASLLPQCCRCRAPVSVLGCGEPHRAVRTLVQRKRVHAVFGSRRRELRGLLQHALDDTQFLLCWPCYNIVLGTKRER